MDITSLAAGAENAARAQRSWRLACPGFYVFNQRTGIEVAGPFPDEDVAGREALAHSAGLPEPFGVKVMDGEG